MTAPLFTPALRRRRVPVRPTFNAQSTAAVPADTGSYTSLAITIPAAAIGGGSTPDYALFFVLFDQNTGTISAPDATFLQLGYQRFGTGPTTFVIFGKFLAATDPGKSVTFTWSTAGNVTIDCVTYSNAGGVSVQPALQWTPQNYTYNSTSVQGQTVPSAAQGTEGAVANIRSNASDVQILAVAARGFNPTATNGPKTASTPSGFTQRSQASFAGFAATKNPQAITVFDSNPNSGFFTVLVNAQSNINTAQVALYGLGDIPKERLNPSLQGVPVYGYGTSYLTHVGTGPYAEWPNYDRMLQVAGSNSASNNMAVQGDMVCQTCYSAFGTVQRSTRGPVGGTDWTVLQSCTWSALPTKTGLVMLDTPENDFFHDGDTTNGGTSAKSQQGYRNGLDAMIRLIRSDQVHNDTDSTVTTTGTGWTSVSDTYCSGGTYKYTTNPGDSFTITTTEQNLDVILLGVDDANWKAGASTSVTPGAAYTVKVNGVQVASGTTSNQMRTPTSNTTFAKSYGQMAVPLRGLASGSKTITVAHAGTTGQALAFDSWLRPSATPPLILAFQLPTSGYQTSMYSANSFPSSNALIPTYNGIIAAVVAQFPPNQVLLYQPDEFSEWNSATMTYTDGVHKLDNGEIIYHQNALRVLRERVP